MQSPRTELKQRRKGEDGDAAGTGLDLLALMTNDGRAKTWRCASEWLGACGHLLPPS